MNGDEVRDTWFGPSSIWHDNGVGYAASEVDDLLRRVAAELDAGRPAGQLIENATFRRKLTLRRYGIDAVDWFLDELLRRLGGSDLAGVSADPWRDLPVAQLIQGGGSDLHGGSCRAWDDFAQQPGMRLCLEWAKGDLSCARRSSGHSLPDVPGFSLPSP